MRVRSYHYVRKYNDRLRSCMDIQTDFTFPDRVLVV